ncbi:MAG: class I SAM-dependent methyltransferase [Pseudonocardiaceae bacterium]
MTVGGELRRLLVDRRGRELKLTSICAGDGRDTLPVLADLDEDVEAALVELDEHLAHRARETARKLGLDGVEVRTADAGLPSSLAGVPPADVFLACGLFGNITDADLAATISALPALLAPNGHVIWTRGANLGEDEVSEYQGDPSDLVRTMFAERGFVEERFVRPPDASFRVGVHRLDRGPARQASPERMFTFVR